MSDTEIDLLLAERAIQRVLMSYSRGVDRYDFDLVRSCYWEDGTDRHGDVAYLIDDFMPMMIEQLPRYERTTHFLGNILIDVDLARDVARAETYAIALHRFQDADGVDTDYWAGLRYVDRFERRDGEWRIAARVVAWDWRRTDAVVGEGGFADHYERGERSTADIIYRILDPAPGAD